MEPLERLIADSPSFHEWGDGSPANWAVTPEVLRFIFRRLSPEMNTLETGAGQTTVVFAIAGTHHVCITPQANEAAKIRDYCSDLGVTGDLTFIHESSDTALPRSELIPASLDFVFIDGAHRFPFACLDWHYTESRLKVGGIVGVDDHTMPSVRILHDFLCGEEEWELLEVIGRTSFFRRIRETQVVLDCHGQNINQRPW